MEPRFVDKGSIRLVGILTAGKLDEIMPKITEIWMERFMKYDELLKSCSPDKAYYGVWTWKVMGEQMAYLAGMAVEGLAEIPQGLEEVVLPPTRYAVFDATVSTFGVVYDKIYTQWLPSSPYEYDYMSADFEYYPPDTKESDSPTQIYIPIKAKAAVQA